MAVTALKYLQTKFC